MFGLAVLVVMGLYLLISIVAVRAAVIHARKQGRRAWVWGLVTAVVMYNLVFWDWLPTVATHQYYCATEAGFWTYKTVDQWKQENPGVMETLPAPGAAGSPTKHEEFDDRHGRTDTYLLNERFSWVVIQQDISSLLPIIRTEHQIKDTRKNEVLARYIDFGSGNSVKNPIGPPGPLKFWLHSSDCDGGDANYGKFLLFKRLFEVTK